MNENKVKNLIKSCGATEVGLLQTAEIKVYEDVRKCCEANSCRGYGKSWACPPAVGSLSECEQRIRQYDNMFLYSRKYELESSFDFNGMREAMQDFKKLSDRILNAFGEASGNALFLSNEGCDRCAECTYPDKPCRFPEKLQHSIEGYGLVVSELAKNCGIKYNNGQNTVTFFGAVLM